MDIVERLRKESYWALSREAADEIERLREALQEIADFEGGDMTKIWRGMRAIAHGALKGGEVVAKDWTQDETIRMLEKKIERLQKENAQLREALQSIKKVPNSEAAYGIIQVFADDALKEKK